MTTVSRSALRALEVPGTLPVRPSPAAPQPGDQDRPALSAVWRFLKRPIVGIDPTGLFSLVRAFRLLLCRFVAR